MSDVISNVVGHPFDEEGVLPENYIQNEQRVLENTRVRAVRPLKGAFFVDTFVMYDANHVLVPPSKYSFDLFSPTITEKLGRAIAGVAILKDEKVVAPVYIDYRCVGGPFGVSNEVIVDLFNRLQNNNRPVSWKNILGKDDAYKPAHHLQDIGDMYGVEYLVAAIDRNTQAFLMGDSASHDEIFRAIDALKGANSEDVAQQVDLLRQELKLHIDQRDNYVIGLINALRDDCGNRFSQHDQSLAELKQRITFLESSSGQEIQTLKQQLAEHIGQQNAHGVTLNSLGGITRQEVDQLIAASNSSQTAYVKKDIAENLSLTITDGKLYSFINGTWRIIWPSQWS